MRPDQRAAFTLMELLVVMAIIATLVALLIPAVQTVRAAAARTQCESNLHQIGVAIHDYYNYNGYLPSAFVSYPAALDPSYNGYDAGWGWGAHLLPYLEQGSLYNAAGVATTQLATGPCTVVGLAAPTQWTQSSLSVFRCPSDLGPALNNWRGMFATSNYRAVMGPNPNDSATVTPYPPTNDLGGCMFQDSRIRLTDVTDGTSNTLIIGECTLDDSLQRWAAIWAGCRGEDPGTGEWYISDVMWYMDNESADINGTAPQAFSSQHPGGAFFLFCDASVHFVRAGVNVNVLMYMAGRNDGVIVSPSDYID